MPQLRISPAAARDLDETYIFGTLRYGLSQADRYLERLRQAFELISDNPLMARERIEVRPPIRLLPVGAHHVFYDVVEDAVIIQRVLHRSADWMNLL
jgi:toxin ParE1/3/4